MTKMTRETLTIKMADLVGESSVPSIFKEENIQQQTANELEEDDELYLGYGFTDDIFPYRRQDQYTFERKDEELPAVVLENEYLKAIFLPTLGARLWQLYDKKARKDLLLTNEEIAFGNLALRSAWFCGGTEWNFGVIGHSPFTCSPLHTAILTADDGTPVVRFYEYERLRSCTYQIDCWLPEDSQRLFVGVRLVNPNGKVIPTYWWSNTAVAEEPGARVIVPAHEAYTYRNQMICKVKELQTLHRDVTYPVQIEESADHFWNMKQAKHRFMAYVNENGYGLCQASTVRQQGRKLFVWGQKQGAGNWQKVLKTGGKTGRYVEIQAGLGQTQYECIPMPPKTAWSWVESYGPIQMDPAVAHGPYDKAREAADQMVAEYGLEEVLKAATHMKRPAEKILLEGSGWGALEECNRLDKNMKPLSGHLQFGNLGEEQQQWLKLIKEGTLGEHNPADVPVSWMFHEDFTERLEKAVAGLDADNWYTWLHLGVIYHMSARSEKALECLSKSITLCENAWAHYALACLYWKQGKQEEALKEAVRTLEIKNDDVSLASEVICILSEAADYARIKCETEKLPQEVQKNKYIQLEYAIAALEEGCLDQAESLLQEGPESYAIYVREGKCRATEFWVALETRKRQNQGKDISGIWEMVPKDWEYRTH